MRTYCTYFDVRFLSRGLALLDSLKRHEGEFTLHALCLDAESHEAVVRLNDPRFVALALGELEAAEPRLAQARANRTLIEYYFTLSPFLPLHVLRANPGIPMVTYVDADCRFYASPQPIYDEWGEGSVLIIEHRFPEADMHKVKWGRYNVGLLAFRNDAAGRRCLERWAAQCLEWCHDRLEDGKFADQRYLDDWPTACAGVHVLRHKGVNLAPWNVSNYKLRRQGGMLRVDEVPLILYHFHALHLAENGEFWPSKDDRDLKAEHIRFLYVPYVQALLRAAARRHVPVGGSVRHAGLGPGASQKPLRASARPWPAQGWLAGFMWNRFRAKRAAQGALRDLLRAFEARDRRACWTCLRRGLPRHPRLLANSHVWNVLFRLSTRRIL